MPTVHLVIKGKVQGVFYRASTKKKAEELGITGWVQNTEEGDVEVVANGSQDALDTFIKWCHEGPSRAQVTGVEVMKKEDSTFKEFIINR